jgi:hypothetical protein
MIENSIVLNQNKSKVVLKETHRVAHVNPPSGPRQPTEWPTSTRRVAHVNDIQEHRQIGEKHSLPV